MKSVLLTYFCALALFPDGSYMSNKFDPSGKEYWYREGILEVNRRVKYLEEVFGKGSASRLTAKNVVFFLGDGMGMSTITASRQLKAYQDKDNLYNNNLVFDKFPFVSLAKVNTYDSMVADSASSATAYLGGVKGNLKTIGVSGKVTLDDCKGSLIDENRVESAFEWAQKEGKATGLVTTMRVTHASPAGLYAHTASRKWEASAPDDCLDIASQLVQSETGKNIRVILGGGWGNMLPKCAKKKKCHSNRNDSKNLVKEWVGEKLKRGYDAAFVTTSRRMKQVDTKKTDYLLGLFAENHMEYAARKPLDSTEPTLTEMALKAVEVLQKDKNGYFLFIEGGLIDHGHHKNRAYLALTETIEFAKAIEAVLAKVNLSETLLVVTGDHSHSMIINGYPPKQDNIATYSKGNKSATIYTALSYGNGPGYLTDSLDGIGDPNYTYKAALYNSKASHSGEDVPVYAMGPGAYLFTGVHDQTYIAHAVRYLLGSKRNQRNPK